MRTEVETLVRTLLAAGIPAESVALELFAISLGLAGEARGLEYAAALCERTARNLRSRDDDDGQRASRH